MKVPLWKWDLDPLFVKALPDNEQNLTSHVGQSVLGITNPVSQIKVNRTIAKLH